MHLDVIDLRDFYARPIGLVARRLIAARINALWPRVDGEAVIGLGYAVPYLAGLRKDARMSAALMPAAQGVVNWPTSGPSATSLVEETEIPLPDASINRVLIVHSLETSEATRRMLREIWRILAPGGRLLVVVPNRRGLWARVDTTPFGFGRPFSRGQLTQILREAMFSPTGWANALYMPPFSWSVLLRSAHVWEQTGAMFWPAFSGVILVEATKQVYAPIEKRAGERVRARMRPAIVEPLSRSPRTR